MKYVLVDHTYVLVGDRPNGAAIRRSLERSGERRYALGARPFDLLEMLCNGTARRVRDDDETSGHNFATRWR